MRAARYDKTGGPEVIQLEEMDVPEPGEGQLRLRMWAAGVNPADSKQRRGLFGDPPPQTVGSEGSGRVDALGAGVAKFKVGDEVFGLLKGATAEFAIGDMKNLVLRPTEVTAIDAAGAPVAALTAWQALFDVAGLQPGQRVLIHAAAGGVGSFAVQLAHGRGARVIGTASAENHDFLLSLGADQAVDYHGSWEEEIEPVNMVLDTIGGETSERSLNVLKEGGTMVSLTREPGEATGRHWRFHSMEPNPGELEIIAGLLASGEIVTHIDRVFPFEGIADAHRESEEGHVQGKLIVRIAEP